VAARAEAIDETAYRKLGKCIGPKKRREQQAHLCDRNSEVVLNELIRHGQGGSIHIIQRAAGNEQDDGPALDRTDARRRSADGAINMFLLRGFDHSPEFYQRWKISRPRNIRYWRSAAAIRPAENSGRSRREIRE
jgi:hypothetical protein